MQAPPGKYLLSIGIHRGTITSRDVEQPKEVASPEAARAELAKATTEYASFGCQIWFAVLYNDQGEATQLVAGAPYSR